MADESSSWALRDDPRWTLALRIAESQSFARSPLLTSFLLFICERSLLGAEDELTEHNIGTTVFKRRPGYKTSEDNIVRNYARQLRHRLEQYFEGPGRAEALRLVLPRGYSPVFEEVSQPNEDRFTAEAPLRDLPDVDPPVAVVTHSPSLPSTVRRFGLTAIIIAGLLVSLSGWLGRHWQARAKVSDASAAHVLWTQMFAANSTSYIVTEDAGLQVLQDLTGRQSTLPEYVDGTFLDGFTEGETQQSVRLHRISRERLTNTPDIDIVARLEKLPEARSKQIFVRNARILSLNDLKEANVILLGSNFADPWLSVFEPRMNFRLQYDLVRNQSHIVNAKPLPGENAVYQDTGTTPPYATYAVIALLPNLTRSGWVLIIEGLTMTGTEAGSEFLLHGDPTPFLAQAKDSKGGLRPFEILLQTTNVSSQSVSARIIAKRVY